MHLFSATGAPRVPFGLVPTAQGWVMAQVRLDGQGEAQPLRCQMSPDVPPEVRQAGAAVVLALPDEHFFFDTLTLPSTVAAEDIEFQLGLLWAERLPWPLEDCAWDWLLLSESAGEVSWSCCAVLKSTVQRWQDWAQKIGCSLLALEPARQALDREARWPCLTGDSEDSDNSDDNASLRLAWGLSLRTADDRAGFNLLPHRALRAAQARQRGWRQLGVCLALLALWVGLGEAVLQPLEAQAEAAAAAQAQAQTAQAQQAQDGRRQTALWASLQAQAEARAMQQRQRSAPLDWILRSVPPPEAGLQWQSVQWQPDRLTWVGLAASELLFNQWRLGLGEASVVQRWEPVRWSSPTSPGSQAAWLFEVRLTPAGP
jgi:Tfp pilus assembly protein PilN